MAAYRIIRQTFAERVQRLEVKTFCKGCKKKLTRFVSRSYYDNGLHNAAVTEKENWNEVRIEAAKLAKKGCLCKSCEDKEEGLPVLRKKDKDNYEVYSRDAKPKLLGRIRRAAPYSGWVKWIVVSPKLDRYGKNCSTLSNAVESIEQHYI